MKGCRFRAPAAQKVDLPARTPDSGDGERRGGARRDAPSGEGRVGLAEQGRFAGAAPAPQRKRQRARCLRGQLQAARGRERKARDLPHHRAEPAMAQPLLETGEQRLFLARLYEERAPRGKARLRERRGKEIGHGKAPEHGAMGARGDPGHEEGRRRSIGLAPFPARRLMQRAEGKAASRQMPVDLLHAEGKAFAYPLACALDAPDAGAQGWEGGDSGRHDRGNRASLFVPFLF